MTDSVNGAARRSNELREAEKHRENLSRGRPAKRKWVEPAIPSWNPNKRCWTCRKKFHAEEAQFYCPDCRKVVFQFDPTRKAWGKLKQHEEAALKRPGREDWEYQIVDENGRLVWNLDLATRYRGEHIRRQQRDYRLVEKMRKTMPNTGRAIDNEQPVVTLPRGAFY